MNGYDEYDDLETDDESTIESAFENLDYDEARRRRRRRRHPGRRQRVPVRRPSAPPRLASSANSPKR
jgi:hypothetical protein